MKSIMKKCLWLVLIGSTIAGTAYVVASETNKISLDSPTTFPLDI